MKTVTTKPATGRIRTWLREPLLQFLLAGVCLLVAQRLFAPVVNSAIAERDSISVSSEQIAVLDEGFRKAMGRSPTAAESKQLLDRWLDEEVMFREGQNLGIDKTDAIVRREVQQKMRYLLEDLSPVSEPTEKDLEAWLAQHAERYGHPGVVSFEQVFLSRARHGDASESTALALLKELQAQPDAVKAGDPFPGGREWRNQSETDLRRAFGGEFAANLREQPEGQWSGPVTSSLGLHLVRIIQRREFRPAVLAEARERVVLDWRLDQRERLNREAVQKLRNRYRVLIDGVPTT